MLKDQRNCALTSFNTVRGVGGGVGTYSVSSARIQFRVFVKKRPNYTTVPRLLSTIVGLIYIVVGYIEIPMYYTNKIILSKQNKSQTIVAFEKLFVTLALM